MVLATIGWIILFGVSMGVMHLTIKKCVEFCNTNNGVLLEEYNNEIDHE
tara:strand:+ start:197 stop:343 length:147 start_codon:yes stop_codon:yes gene_type:complete